VTSHRRIVLWRHGRTEWNASRRFQGQTDIPLDQIGIAQARHAAEQLATLQPRRIISSDLQRAFVTAQTLSDLCNVPVISDPGLRETFAGVWEGLTREEIVRDYGNELAAWAAGSDLRPGGNGESRTEVAARMLTVINRELEHVGTGQTIVVVTHGGSARAVIAQLIGLPPEHWAALGVLTNCAWSVLTEKDSEFGPPWRLQEYNAGSLPVPALADDR
jgi:glucosyl-3-phosphoglycerate phosphatase